MDTYHDIYDRIGKRCLTLSNRAIIQFINGVYGVDHPLDSKVIYNWTEHVDENLSRTLADTIITIDYSYSYHIELQMALDGSITFRILEYGFRHALKNHGNEEVLEFPEPVLFYLFEGQTQPDVQKLTIKFGNQGEFVYSVPTIKYLSLSQEELEQKKMIILIPFQLLKLRKTFEKERTPDNIEALKSLVSHDIIETIKINVQAGNITTVDAQKLGRMTQILFHHIYDRYPEVEEEGVDDEVDDALIFDIDILEYEISQRVKKEVTEEVTQKFSDELAEKDAEILAMKLLIKGKSIEAISKQTGLLQERVENLQVELNL